MKESNTGWLGKIPSEWDSCRLKYLFSIKKDIAGELGHSILSVTQRGIVPKNMSEKGQFASDYSKYQLVHCGDFVMNHMDLLTGWVDISEYDGVTSPDYRVFVVNDKYKTVSEYYKYIFQYCYSNRIFYGLGQGVAGFGRWRLPATMFLNFVLPVPSFDDQIKIASFLESQCSQIDAIIDDSKASIKEYKTWKASIIFEAVTKGIDPTVEMKDIKIEWIGKIPLSWKKTKIKYIFKIVSGATPKSDFPDYWDGNIAWITPADYKTDDKYVCSGRKSLTLEGYNACSTTLLPPESIVFSKRAPIGAVAITEKELCTNQGCLGCIPKIACNIDYYYYALSSFTEQFNLLGTGTTFREISASSFGEFVLPHPEILQQNIIVDYLNEKCGIINSLITEKQDLISELESYKRSLIYETVTGKRKVV